MPVNRFYYHLKPYLPWRLRMGLRRILARRRLKACRDVWPINEPAGNPRVGWKGWPGVSKFTLVLTHDVEGPTGLAKCRQLMQLEMKYGLRSSFNFIPEGDYRVSRELREELAGNGFEVGVHDLHHDGKLYHSRRNFSQDAVRINKYLKEWGADGFRSGFMLRELDWLHDLNILYDASTFDTDPFEPQPGGVGTIFPFWVPVVKRGNSASDASNSRSRSGCALDAQSPSSNLGFVELPYTLPQDSTLFFVLKARSSAMWKRKLDWIAQRGGMALINVHPDYLGFDGHNLRKAEYPAAWYEEFLRYVQSRYNGEMWNALPCEAAGWYKEKCVPEPSVQAAERVLSSGSGTVSLAGRNVGVTPFSHDLSDPRPRRGAEMPARHETNAEVVCPRSSAEELRRETVNA